MTKVKTKKAEIKPIEELKKEAIVEHVPDVVKIEEPNLTDLKAEPVVIKEVPKPEIIAPKKEVVSESEEMKFLRTLVYNQYHGGRGSYLNEMIIERAKAVLKCDCVFIENGEIII